MIPQHQKSSQGQQPSRQQLQREWFQQLLVSGDLDEDNNMDWLRMLREDARQSIKTLPVLHRKQEAWRYNRVDNIFKNNFDPHFYPQFDPLIDSGLDIDKVSIKDYLLPSFDSYQLVFVNGRCAEVLSDISELPDGVILDSVAAAIRTMPEQLAHYFEHKHNEQLFNALNNALFNDGVYLHIDQSVKLDRPVEIIYINSNQTPSEQHDGSIIQTRNIIDLDVGTSATVMEYFISSHNNEKYFHNNVTDIVVADDAQLKHVRLQDESRMAHHLSSMYVTQNKHSHYHSTSIALGGAWSKTNINVDFKAQQAECDLHGLYTVGDQQLTDFHLDVLHRVPSCRSREQFKGILYGKGRAVFDGRILVDKQAQHSDAALTNDNLLLVHDAEVDTKPQLEIYADDVKCSHGTTVGRLDPQQLFYLRSRGIAEHDARKMLCQGFASEIIDGIEHAMLRDYMSEKISRTLNMNEPHMADLNG